MSRFLFFLYFLIPVISSSAQSTTPWEIVDLGKERYVTIESVKTFYGFTRMERAGNKITLTKPGVRVEFLIGQQDVWMNNIKFFFSYPVRPYQSKHLVHHTDLTKLFDPVMRPFNLSKYSGFDTVIIDPGHGGHDPGTSSRQGNGVEKDHTLILAKKLSLELRKRNFKVGLTRDTDRFLTLQQRVDYANKHPNAIFISLHFNSGGGGRATGIETFTLSPKGVAHYGRGLRASDHSVKPGNNNDAANIALATAIHANCIKATARVDRGVRRARYSVISGVKHPAILLEGGFLSNKEEGRLIASQAYQDRLAFAIAEAVVKYKLATRGGGSGQARR